MKWVYYVTLPTILSLNACTTVYEMGQVIEKNWLQKRSDISSKQNSFDEQLSSVEARHAMQDVPHPWLAGTAQPLARELSLPALLQHDVDITFMFGTESVDLLTISDRIMMATKIPVRIQPEALLPVSDFMLSTSTDNRSSDTEDSRAGMYGFKVSLPSGKQSLPKLLDMVANRLSVFWRYNQGAIEFYRLETRSFNVRALTLKSSTNVTLGRTSSKSEGVFESSGETRYEVSGTDSLLAVKDKLQGFMTKSGRIVANPDSSSYVVITDTPDSLARIDQYLEKENRALTRRVRLMFERIELQLSDSSEMGIDWNIIARAVATQNPSSLTSSLVGKVTLERVRDGSTLVIKALSDVGKVISHTRVPMQGINRRPMTHAVRTTFSYIDQVQTTTVASAAGTTSSPSVTQKEETVGSFLTIVPDAQEDGQILLSVSYDNTVALPLKTLTFGSSDNEVFLQQKTIDGVGTIQQLQVQAGQTVIVSGFERSVEQAEGRRLDSKLPILLGGSSKASQQRIVTLVLVTAQVEEGV